MVANQNIQEQIFNELHISLPTQGKMMVVIPHVGVTHVIIELIKFSDLWPFAQYRILGEDGTYIGCLMVTKEEFHFACGYPEHPLEFVQERWNNSALNPSVQDALDSFVYQWLLSQEKNRVG